ncbi:MAG: N-acetyltransferase family protein [Sedimentitalea sp.]
MSVFIRPARTTDAGKIGDILWRFQHQHDWMPVLYSGVETIAFCGQMIDRGWVTVAERERMILGFLARDGDDVCSLYVDAAQKRQGVGRELLDHAKSQNKRLTLRAFEANVGAQKFYSRQGFVERNRCAGTNAENLPEIHFEWKRKDARS